MESHVMRRVYTSGGRTSPVAGNRGFRITSNYLPDTEKNNNVGTVGKELDYAPQMASSYVLSFCCFRGSYLVNYLPSGASTCSWRSAGSNHSGQHSSRAGRCGCDRQAGESH